MMQGQRQLWLCLSGPQESAWQWVGAGEYALPLGETLEEPLSLCLFRLIKTSAYSDKICAQFYFKNIGVQVGSVKYS